MVGISVNVRLHRDEKDALDAYAKKNKISQSEAVRRAVRFCFDLDNKDKFNVK